LLEGECAPSFGSGSIDDLGRETSDERAGGGRAEKPPRTRDVARRAIKWPVGTTRVFEVAGGKLEQHR
jgi:hypothetical protein